MFRKYRPYWCVLAIGILLLSCKKRDVGRFQLSSLNLTNVYGLVIPKDSGTLTKQTVTNELYKLTALDSLEAIDYINVDGFDMNGYYAPEYFYPINTQYFLATFAILNSNPKVIESFIINYATGKAIKLPSGYYPMRQINGVWQQEPNEKSIIAGPDNNYYFRGEDRVYNITQTALDLFQTQILGISGTSSSVFEVDAMGDIMVGGVIYSSPAVFYQSSVYSSANSYVSASALFNNGFTIVKLVNNQIQVFHSYIEDNHIQEDTVSVIENEGNGWQYIGGYSFTNPSQVIYVFDQGLVQVNASGASIITFSNLPLASIQLADQSAIHLYLIATDGVNEKVFLQVTPENNPVTYSQIFSPDQFQVTHINVLGNDDFMFQGTDLTNNTQIFGFYTGAVMKEVVNYHNITARQLIAVE